MTEEDAIKVLQDVRDRTRNPRIIEAICTLHPELAESEDERIRKKLVEIIGYFRSRGIDQQLCEKFLAYLEKQKEQKPVDIDYINGIRDELLGIEDSAKDIDGLTDSQWVAIRAAHRLLGEYIEQKQKPEERFEEAREKYQVEWSEEDDACYETIKGILEDNLTEEDKPEYVLSWFKLHYFRPSWKPSEEQIYSLGTVVKGYNECTVGSVGYHLKEMYEQLKKLM